MVKDIQENYGSGWIKIYRSIRKHWLWDDEKKFKAWVTILLEVNHEPNKALIDGNIISCDRGQKLYSIKTWAKLFGNGWTRQKVRTFFNLLEKDSMIVIKGTSKTTILTVCNYNSYQDRQPSNNQRLTNAQPTLNHNRRTKELKNDKNIYIHPLQKFIYENLKQVTKLGIPTEKELDTITSKYPQDLIIDKLCAMENKRDLLKKYNSTYLTLNNWCKNGTDKGQSAGSVRSRLDYRFNEDNAKKRLEEIREMFGDGN